MSRILLRIMTRKSILNFGYAGNRDLSVQMMLDIGRKKQLISSYFGLEKINYTVDILEEIGIYPHFIIDKPGKVTNIDEMVNKVYQNLYKDSTDIERMMASNKSKKANNLMRNRNITLQEKHNNNTEYLKRKNHGK